MPFVYTGSELPSLTLAGSAWPDDLTRSAQVVVEPLQDKLLVAITTCEGAEGPVTNHYRRKSPAVSIVTPTNGGMVYATDNSTIKAEATTWMAIL